MIVILDNGHGSNTPGKRSPKWPDGRQLFEFEFNRSIVDLVGHQLNGLGITYKLTCPEVIDVSIGERVKRANKFYADAGKKGFLISVHANASPDPVKPGSGWEAFVAPNASQASKDLGRIFYDEARISFPEWKIRDSGVPISPAKVGNFQIIRETHCPAILTENFFMDNFRDFEFINSITGRQAVANLHVRSIFKFLKR